MATKQEKQARALRKTLEAQGRTVTWLADEMGYSRGYVSNVLGGKHPFTEEFQAKATQALKATATVPVLFRGRQVLVPANIYKEAADLPLISVETAYEEAWKRSWLQEHGSTSLAVAAERAWQAQNQADVA